MLKAICVASPSVIAVVIIAIVIYETNSPLEKCISIGKAYSLPIPFTVQSAPEDTCMFTLPTGEIRTYANKPAEKVEQ